MRNIKNSDLSDINQAGQIARPILHLGAWHFTRRCSIASWCHPRGTSLEAGRIAPARIGLPTAVNSAVLGLEACSFALYKRGSTFMARQASSQRQKNSAPAQHKSCSSLLDVG